MRRKKPWLYVFQRQVELKKYRLRLSEKPVLSEEELKELVDMALKVETFYGKPQDLEWAYENNRLYLLQSRPITTLS